MSAKSLMVQEGLLQEIEQRIARIRSTSTRLVTQRGEPEFSFSDGMELMAEYDDHLEVLQEVAGQLFVAIDLQDPEDLELQRREEEEEEDEEEDEDEDEEGDGDEDGDDDH